MDSLADVLSDVDGATCLLADAVRAAAAERGALTFLLGEAYYQEWRGDLLVLARTVWRDLPLARTHPDTIEVMTTLIPVMRGTGILALQSRPNTWRVRVDPPTTEPHMKLHTCDHCCYTDTERSVATHVHKLRDTLAESGSHPQDEGAPFDCPAYGGCLVKLPTVLALVSHVRKKHNAQFAGRHMCRQPTCLQWFPGMKEVDAHSLKQHGVPVIHRRTKGDLKAAAAPEPETNVVDLTHDEEGAPGPELDLAAAGHAVEEVTVPVAGHEPAPQSAPEHALPDPGTPAEAPPGHAHINAGGDPLEPVADDELKLIASGLTRVLEHYDVLRRAAAEQAAVADLTEAHAALDAKNAALTAENAALDAENAALRSHLTQIRALAGVAPQ